MNKDESGINRRNFFRILGVIGVGLGFNFRAESATAESATPEALKAVKPRSKISVGFEIGALQICAVVAERWTDGTSQILGAGPAPSRGIRQCEIDDAVAVKECLTAALAEAEERSDVMIRTVRLTANGPEAGLLSQGSFWKVFNELGLEVDAIVEGAAVDVARRMDLPG